MRREVYVSACKEKESARTAPPVLHAMNTRSATAQRVEEEEAAEPLPLDKLLQRS